MNNPLNDYLTISEAAQILNVSIRTLLRWHNKGKLIPKFQDQHKKRFYLKSTILELAEREKSK